MTRYSTDRHTGYRQQRAAGNGIQTLVLLALTTALVGTGGWYLFQILSPIFTTLTNAFGGVR